jgi:hypothetical protein
MFTNHDRKAFGGNAIEGRISGVQEWCGDLFLGKTVGRLSGMQGSILRHTHNCVDDNHSLFVVILFFHTALINNNTKSLYSNQHLLFQHPNPYPFFFPTLFPELSPHHPNLNQHKHGKCIVW